MIRQFDVFQTPFRRDRAERPYYVVIQSDRFETLSRMCAPLIVQRFINPNGRLNPRFELEGTVCFFHPIELISIPAVLLRVQIANLEAERCRIIAAVDLMLTGV